MASDAAPDTDAPAGTEAAAPPEASPDISLPPQRVAERLERGGVQVIDLREGPEWDAGHVPGARRIELERVSSDADTIDKGQPVVFQCRGGSRSGLVAAAFRESGWEAYNMDGGLRAWEQRDLPLEPRGGRIEGARAARQR